MWKKVKSCIKKREGNKNKRETNIMSLTIEKKIMERRGQRWKVCQRVRKCEKSEKKMMLYLKKR